MSEYVDISMGRLYHGDCLEVMKEIPNNCVDMVLCDLPYGTTYCKWDTVIPFESLWNEYNRLCKGAVLLFGSEPFSTQLRISNIKSFKYDWIWNKKLAGNGILAKQQPLKIHEIISMFSKEKCNYFPQKTKGKFRSKMTSGIKKSEIHNGDEIKSVEEYKNDEYYPISIQEFGIGNLRSGRLHPTQKPVELFEYLIKTYTNEGMLVLDNCSGSGTTAIACENLKRRWICIEKDEEYCTKSYQRIKQHVEELAALPPPSPDGWSTTL